jgi:hypothetical protein
MIRLAIANSDQDTLIRKDAAKISAGDGEPLRTGAPRSDQIIPVHSSAIPLSPNPPVA